MCASFLIVVAIFDNDDLIVSIDVVKPNGDLAAGFMSEPVEELGEPGVIGLGPGGSGYLVPSPPRTFLTLIFLIFLPLINQRNQLEY